MTDKRRLLAAGMPLEDAISNCYAMRREGTLREFIADAERSHKCTCGGAHNCPDCPNKKR